MPVIDTPGAPPPRKAGAIRTLYDWMMRNASGKHAWRILAIFTFAEASFFPIPTDIMLIPMALADRRRAWLLGAWCTLWSVLGGALGYAIGAFLYESLGSWLIRLYHLNSDMVAFQAWYAQHGAWIILIKGMTPIPYKIVTIASGFAGYDFFMFVVLSTITRGARFFLEAELLRIYGEPIRGFIEKRLTLVTTGFLAAIVGGFLIAKYAF